ncbi:5'-nucleotidase C-terminal domain-containing protein [Cyanobium sp. ATX 6A2]|uniref:bifunctional metallophosphatase/5'-nucleotidase n=1 Tax=Cyanobium sp. ATX 6A2 TaxID=2823700 RepID=UPI0020CDC974|nr:5'-nucleotidase C-terminal domain-containing protein [Cyanobium sp. ATX 6A2]MCP9887456.1 5'-nucleotidase C-terminal domain-containing protein [Cyanobium sp. ATX 6A2]
MKVIAGLVVWACTALVLPAWGAPADRRPSARGAEPFTLTILHINDHHSHLEPRPLNLDPAVLGQAGAPAGALRLDHGGFPLLTALFEERRRGNQAVLSLHAGDAITGTLFSTLFEGAADAALMNRICFDAFALGNHEFDHGDAALARFLDVLAEGSCNTTVLSANVAPHDASPLRGRLQPSAVFERAGRRIGVIGVVIAHKTRLSSSPDPGTQFGDEIASARAEIQRLRAQGVAKIILLTHLQYANERALARALPGVDVVVGGDSHTLLGDAEALLPLGFSPDGPYPTLEVNADGDPVCVVQAFDYARVMGELQVRFDPEGRVIDCAGGPRIPVDASAAGSRLRAALDAHPVLHPVVPDPQSAALLEDFAAALSDLRQAVIGEVAENLCLVRLPGEGRAEPLCARADTYAQGAHITTLVAKAFLAREGSADIAIQNAGGVRGSVPAGPVTIADVFTLLPFTNTLHVLNLSGAEIIETLELAVADAASGGGAFPYAAGLRFAVDLSAAPGSRISTVEVNPRLTGDWTPIDPQKRYAVVTNSFIAGGGDGYAVFARASAEGRGRDTFAEYAQSFVNYVRGRSASGQLLTRPAPERRSTQRFINAEGCDHSQRLDCR